MTPASTPLLAMPFDATAMSAWAIAEAASGRCALLWLVGSREVDRADLRLLARLGTVADLAGLPLESWADAVRPHHPDGLIVFSDRNMVANAEMAEQLGLVFHSPATARCLTDKHLQREALGQFGLGVPKSWDVAAEPSRADVARIAGEVNFPAVLKPRYGSDSRLTFPVADGEALHELVDSLGASGERLEMVLEEYLSDTSPRFGEQFANYLSVESMVQDGEVEHFATTGRFPLAEPFRETGFFIPSTAEGELRDEVLELATGAIRALGVRSGCLHIEIKVTREGLRVIEVNGRLGGGVSAMLELASGVSAVELAMRVALGDKVEREELGQCSGVGYRLLHQPPTSATRVLEVTGLERLSELEGVSAVSLHRGPGSPVSWRTGSYDFVFAVAGLARDHSGVSAIRQTIDEYVQIVYEE